MTPRKVKDKEEQKSPFATDAREEDFNINSIKWRQFRLFKTGIAQAELEPESRGIGYFRDLCKKNKIHATGEQMAAQNKQKPAPDYIPRDIEEDIKDLEEDAVKSTPTKPKKEKQTNGHNSPSETEEDSGPDSEYSSEASSEGEEGSRKPKASSSSLKKKNRDQEGYHCGIFFGNEKRSIPPNKLFKILADLAFGEYDD